MHVFQQHPTRVFLFILYPPRSFLLCFILAITRFNNFVAINAFIVPLGLERNAASRAKTGRYTWAMDEYRVEGRRRGRKEKRGNEKDTKGSVEARTRSSAFSSLTWIWKRGCGCRTRLAGNAACRCPGASFRRKPPVLLLKIASCPKLSTKQQFFFATFAFRCGKTATHG